jgi:hypothetical protein
MMVLVIAALVLCIYECAVCDVCAVCACTCAWAGFNVLGILSSSVWRGRYQGPESKSKSMRLVLRRSTRCDRGACTGPTGYEDGSVGPVGAGGITALVSYSEALPLSRTRRMARFLAAVVAASLAAAWPQPPSGCPLAVVYVATNGTDSPACGATWDTPCATLRWAFASRPGPPGPLSMVVGPGNFTSDSCGVQVRYFPQGQWELHACEGHVRGAINPSGWRSQAANSQRGGPARGPGYPGPASGSWPLGQVIRGLARRPRHGPASCNATYSPSY